MQLELALALELELGPAPGMAEQRYRSMVCWALAQ